MPRQIFVNLPVADLPRSIAFWQALGFHFNPQFTNDAGACLVIDPQIYAMLLTRPFFQTFTHKEIANAETTVEVLNCLSCESREEVDSLVAKAVAAGGRASGEPKDHGFMYGHAFEDPDGHTWELVFMSGPPPAAP